MRVDNRRVGKGSNPVFVEQLESRTYFDLVPTIAGVLPVSAIAQQHTTAAITVDLQNTGGATIHGAYSLSILVSLDGMLGDATPVVVKNLNLLPLATGKTRAVRIPLGEFPLVANGSYNVLAEVGGTLAGIGDNVAASSGTVAITDPFIDLTDTIVLRGATSIKPGQNTTVAITVFNEGNVTAKGLLPIDIGTSVNSDGSSPTPVAEPSKRISLAPNHHITFVFAHKVPVGFVPGTYFATADIDPLNSLNDTNTVNNFGVTATALTVLDPFKDILGNLTGTFRTTRGAGRGGSGTVSFDVLTESNTNGAITGTGSNSVPANFTFTGSISATGVVNIFGDDSVDGITSVLKGRVVGNKINATFSNSNGAGGTIVLTL